MKQAKGYAINKRNNHVCIVVGVSDDLFNNGRDFILMDVESGSTEIIDEREVVAF